MSVGNLRDLNQCVHDLRQVIQRLRKRSGQISEEDTKRVLINPLLEALGWNTLDVEEVRSEYRYKSQDNPVDYALFLLRTPALFLEAKALGKNLEDRKWVSQIIGYAATAGVEWCVLTNGDMYRLYNAHAAVDADEKLFRSVTITQPDDEALTVETLSLLSKENMEEKRLDVHWKIDFVDKRVKAAFEGAISEPDGGLVRVLHKRTKGLSAKEIRASIERANVQVDFPVLMDHAPQGTGKELRTRRSKDDRRPPVGLEVELGDLIAAGVIEVPFQLEATFKKRRFTATVHGEDEIEVNGARYSSVSTAAGMVRNQVNGPPPDGRKIWHTNGWDFWKYRDPDGRLYPLSRLRTQLDRKKAD